MKKKTKKMAITTKYVKKKQTNKQGDKNNKIWEYILLSNLQEINSLKVDFTEILRTVFCIPSFYFWPKFV